MTGVLPLSDEEKLNVVADTLVNWHCKRPPTTCDKAHERLEQCQRGKLDIDHVKKNPESCNYICYVELLLWEVVPSITSRCIEQYSTLLNISRRGEEQSSTSSPYLQLSTAGRVVGWKIVGTFSPELQHWNAGKAVGLLDCGARSCNAMLDVELIL
jgi:hypothetical protein